MKIQGKLNTGYLILAILISTVAYVAVDTSLETRRSYELISDHTIPGLDALQNIKVAALRVVASTNEYALIISEREAAGIDHESAVQAGEHEEGLIMQAYASFDEAQQSFDNHANSETGEAGDRHAAQMIRNATADFRSAADRLVAMKKHGVSGTIVLDAKEAFEVTEKNLLKVLDHALEHEHSQFVSNEQHTLAVIARAGKEVIIAVVFMFTSMILSALLIKYFIVRPIDSLRETVSRVEDTAMDPGIEDELYLSVQQANAWQRDEVTEFAQVFADTHQRLRTAREALEEHKESLKSEVKKRTLELEKSVEQANELAQQAQAADQVKSEFLARMSHELRTPMNAVMGMTDLLLSSDLNPQQKSFAEIVMKSSNELLVIINDILDFSRIEAGQLKLHHREFNLLEMVESTTTAYASVAQDKGLELLFDIQPGIWPMYIVDVDRLRQVFINLLSNAIKFTSSGEVVVSLRVIETKTDSDVISLEVSDTGIGISKDLHEHIFSLFSQVDGSSTREFGGSGLGLTISRDLITMLGGELLVDSEEGKGSVFTIRIPLMRGQKAPALNAENGKLQNRKVLLLDDNARCREILTQQLQNLQMQVVTCTQIEDAIQQLQQAETDGAEFDLLILDNQMQAMTSPEFLEFIHGPEGTTKQPIITLNNFKQVGDNQPHVNIRLIKPVSQAKLIEAMESVLNDIPVNDVTYQDQHVNLKRHLLLVEDNPANQAMVEQMLSKLGCTVALAKDGEQALQLYSAHQFDAILLDCQIPLIDGYKVSQSIRGLEACGSSRYRVPIIAMTASALTGDREKCMDSGMDDYLSKPFTLRQLQHVLERWLGDEHYRQPHL